MPEREIMTTDGQLVISNHSQICPVTGLPITSKPGWTEIHLASDWYEIIQAHKSATEIANSRSRGTTITVLVLAGKNDEQQSA